MLRKVLTKSTGNDFAINYPTFFRRQKVDLVGGEEQELIRALVRNGGLADVL